MATINISSVVSYYNTSTRSKSGNGSGSGASRALAADAARSNAESLAYGIDGGTPASGGSSSTTDLKFGSNYSSVSASIGTPVVTGGGTKWSATCSYSSNRTSTMYQLKLKFTIPNGLTAANIELATISFTAKAGDTNTQTYYLCAPKATSEQTNYQKYSETTIIDTAQKVSFTAPGNTTDTSYSLTITDIFKQCITKGQGWVTILLPRDTPEATRTMTLSGTPQITYRESYSACGAPTSVSCGTAIQKPGATVSISWSGATAGTNNTIAGYTVYYNAGSAPTTSSSSVNVNASPYTFTIPSGATRGTTYYFKVLTRGSVSGYNSGLSSAQATTKVNSLPAVPSVTVNKARIKSTGEAVTFTVTAGSDSDTGQTLSVWYNTDGSSWSGSNCKQVPSNGQLTTGTLTATITYYFRTWDGLEYSSSYTSKTITKNTPPTISSITMSAVATYTPSASSRSYVKNINGSASGVTGTNLSYQWYLCVGSGTDATSFGTVTNISTATSLSNIDVTSYGANFNTAYKLALTVTDDLGESVTAWSSTVYVIPPAPTNSTIYNQKGSGNKGGNTNPSHFEDGIRIVYSPTNNTGVTRELQYSTSSSFNSYSTISLSGTEYSDVTLSSLTRGTTYYFRVKYTCNTKTTTSTVSSGYMRANDITPNISTITPQSGSAIKPYTQSLLNFTFTNSPISWTTTNDVATSYGSIYSIKLKYSTRELVVNSSLISHSSSSVSATVTLSSIPTSGTGSWKTLLGTTNAPNTSYTLTLEVTATNGFGATFVSSKTFTANFIEGFVANQGSLTLKIKTGAGASDFTDIPTGTYNSNNRYPLFPTQTIRFTVSGLQCYANQDFRIEARDTNADGTILGSTTGSASDWELLTGSNRIYKLKNSKSIDYLINSISTTTNKTFCMKIILDNNQTKIDLTSSICKYRRIQTSSISPKIFLVSESESQPNNFTFTYQITDYGGDSTVETGFSSASLQGGYSAITGRFFKCSSAGGTYSTVGPSTIDLKGKSTDNQTITINDSGTGSLNTDIIYFGFKLYLTVAFVKIGSATPTGTSYYEVPSSTKPFQNLYTFYRETPNLLYGKNFFALNQNQPVSGRTKQLLEISTAQYISGNSSVTRDTIYFGTDGTNFQITGNGLEIDCGSW